VYILIILVQDIGDNIMYQVYILCSLLICIETMWLCRGRGTPNNFMHIELYLFKNIISFINYLGIIPFRPVLNLSWGSQELFTIIFKL